ncbi:class I SAM-dependent methyltransferase [Burkholderia ubonensis]|uniref:class I SAM-dependent methyltransferase n=1 Tax=Burkholderia ubonensis TaxID=101571 RepID=UPI000AC61AB4|nr:class I SAM-dependent methyltransferase [Burkholderia ubonensis]
MEDDAIEVFSRIYREREWGSQESVSGRGSELRNAAQIIRELPALLRRLGVRSMLDAPCGDFNWMRYVELGDVTYVGADIVADLVEKNEAEHGGGNRSFVELDLLRDRLPDCDLILCRDCLFHFSHADVLRAFGQFANTTARYLLTTTFVYRTYPRNGDIVTGQWTPINLELPPYNLAPPIALLIEGSSESIDYGPELGIIPMADRCLGLWHMDAIRESIRK